MIVVNVREAERDFGAVLKRVMSGEEVVISSDDKEIAVVSPLMRPSKPRKPGSAKGRISISADFDAPLPEGILREFEQ